MRTQIGSTLAAAMLLASAALEAQVENPIPAPIVKRGLAVEIRNVARLPDSSALDPASANGPVGWARVSFVRDTTDGQRFANDSRGGLYRIDANGEPHLFLDLAPLFPGRLLPRPRERLHWLRLSPRIC